MDKLGNGGKGIGWNTEDEVHALIELNGKVREEGVSKGCQDRVRHRRHRSGADAGPRDQWSRGRQGMGGSGQADRSDHTHLALHREDEKIRYRDIQAQPRKIISSPTWSGLESEKVSYNAGYTNVHELIPWRTLTGRQQFYMDHPWMIAFGEGFVSYRPPVDLKAVEDIKDIKPNGNKEISLNFITPHQKWGIHSTYTDNLLMLTLNRGGPVIWLSEDDAKSLALWTTTGLSCSTSTVPLRPVRW
jgi:nitrate reductase alpha subunit